MIDKNREKTFRDTDDIIDATLVTLHNTPTPTGLEDRLLRTLESAQRVPHVSLLRRGWTGNPFSPSLWLPTGLAVAAFAAALFFHHPTPTPVISTGAESSGEIPALPTARTASTTYPSVILSESQRSRRTRRPSTDRSSPNLPTSTPYDQALADALAPSQPAPPLPLTRQERLLLRCSRRGQPIEVATLDLDQQTAFHAATDPREKALLQRYIKGLLNTLVDFQPIEPTPSPDEAQPPSEPPTPVQQPSTSY